MLRHVFCRIIQNNPNFAIYKNVIRIQNESFWIRYPWISFHLSGLVFKKHPKSGTHHTLELCLALSHAFQREEV